MTSIDTATAAAVGLLWFAGIAALYVWTALALAAVFRKSGELGWRAWVPILNQVVLFRLGGVSPLLLLLYLLPGVGLLAVWVFQIIACHRINVSFGLGTGMTVLAALLLPVWASVVGFGSSRWVGDEAGPRRTGPTAGSSRSSSFDPVGPQLPAPPSSGAGTPFFGRTTLDQVYSTASDVVAPPAPAPGRPAPFAPSAVPVSRSEAPIAPPTARSQSPVPPPAGGWAPPPLPTSSPAAEADEPTPPVSSVPTASFRGSSADRRGASAEDAGPIMDWSDIREHARPAQGRETFDDPARFAPVSEDTGEVTGAVTGVPAPLSAVSAKPAPTPIPPAVLRVPAATTPSSSAAWSPSRSPVPESEAFPDTSGPVSAIAGAPDAGAPRSARSSVSAQTRRAQIPDDPLDETIIARRRRTDWSLIPPGGEPVAIGAEVVLLGRRPAPDPANPGAQLIVIDDGTVSKTHARLQLRGEKWYVTDLGSTNGVVFATLMGTEVEATPGVEIEAGDRFLLGDAEVRLVRSAE